MTIFYLPIYFNKVNNENIDFKYILDNMYKMYSFLKNNDFYNNNEIINESQLSYYINRMCKWNYSCLSINCKYLHEDDFYNNIKEIYNDIFINFMNNNFNISIINNRAYKYSDNYNKYNSKDMDIVKITNINEYFKIKDDFYHDDFLKNKEKGIIVSITFKEYHIALKNEHIHYLKFFNNIINIINKKIYIMCNDNFINYFTDYLILERKKKEIISTIPLKDWIINHHCVNKLHPHFSEWEETGILFDGKSKELLEESYFEKILFLSNGIFKYQTLLDAYTLTDDEFKKKYDIDKPNIDLYNGLNQMTKVWLKYNNLPTIKKINLPKTLKESILLSIIKKRNVLI